MGQTGNDAVGPLFGFFQRIPLTSDLSRDVRPICLPKVEIALGPVRYSERALHGSHVERPQGNRFGFLGCPLGEIAAELFSNLLNGCVPHLVADAMHSQNECWIWM